MLPISTWASGSQRRSRGRGAGGEGEDQRETCRLRSFRASSLPGSPDSAVRGSQEETSGSSFVAQASLSQKGFGMGRGRVPPGGEGADSQQRLLAH